MEEIHLIPDPERGPNQYVDAIALARGEVHVFALREGMTYADFAAEMVAAERQAAEEQAKPQRDVTAELDAALARIVAIEASLEEVEVVVRDQGVAIENRNDVVAGPKNTATIADVF